MNGRCDIICHVLLLKTLCAGFEFAQIHVWDAPQQFEPIFARPLGVWGYIGFGLKVLFVDQRPLQTWRCIP